VVGGSGGGPSAIEFAARYPERCAALVLEEAITMQLKPVEPGFIEVALTKTLGLDFSVWLIKDSFTAGLQAKDPSDLKITSIATAIFNSTVPAVRRAAGHENDIAQWAAISELSLKNVHCPTLILQGTADTNVPIAHGEFAHAQIAGSQIVQLPGEDHWMVITKHKELGELIQTFLVKHESATP
jgi:pimeloyl-ACP methyl ester carboxylesterase